MIVMIAHMNARLYIDENRGDEIINDLPYPL